MTYVTFSYDKKRHTNAVRNSNIQTYHFNIIHVQCNKINLIMFIPKTAHQVGANVYSHTASHNMLRPSMAISREVVNKKKHNIGQLHNRRATVELKTDVIHHHHHHHIACRVLCLVTCSGPIKSQEFSRGVVLGFVSHTVDISQ